MQKCPSCKGKFKKGSGYLRCSVCGAVYHQEQSPLGGYDLVMKHEGDTFLQKENRIANLRRKIAVMQKALDNSPAVGPIRDAREGRIALLKKELVILEAEE